MTRMASRDPTDIPPVRDRFGYLLKHARERLTTLTEDALRPFDLNGRELAVLTVLADGEPPSQLEAAQRLSIDRTSMVALIDVLEAQGLVERNPDPDDRRRNIVALTAVGRRILSDASRASDEAERAFLAPLAEADGDRLRVLLQAVLSVKAPGRHTEGGS
jgi:DNA-binding MarR family transcriptional regulator